MTISLQTLPIVNAALNFLSAILLLTGYYLIKTKRPQFHKIAMLSAFGTSTLFLISYLIYHFQAGAKPYPLLDWTRSVYYSILISHIILAITILPLALWTLTLALKKKFVRHKGIARVVFPIWIYVSITGIVIYWMLYER